jgi:arylsulfatase A-like enzyme
VSTLLLSLLACSPVEIGAKAYRRPAASPVEDSGHTDCSSLPLTEEPRAQNLVLLTWDTTRRDHLTPYGYVRDTTPALADWSEKAVVFDRHFSTAPWTKPAFASIFSSLHPHEHGVVQWEDSLAEDLVTLPLQLQAEGLATHATVSHLAFSRSMNNFHAGFDVFDDSVWLGVGSPSELTTSTDVADLAIEALDGLPEPFFLWVHFFDPHSDYLHQEDHIYGERDIDLYDGEIAHTDAQMGRLLNALEAHADDTAVIFVADHGEEFGDHGGREHTNSLYNELIHVPMIARIPGVKPQRISHTTSHLDLAPSLLSWLGLSPLPSFRGRALPIRGDQICLVDDAWVFSEADRFADLRSFVDWPYKVIRDRQADTWQLFDVQWDPRETIDLSASAPETLDAMRQVLLAQYPE